MLQKWNEWKNKYWEMALYLIFGVLTTLVNIAAYYCLTRMLSADTTVATAAAWFLSVLFAYVTNRIWVFQSRASCWKAVVQEALGFFAARLATGMMDMGVMALCADLLALPDMPVKLASNVMVIIANYLLSKLFIFRKANSKYEK